MCARIKASLPKRNRPLERLIEDYLVSTDARSEVVDEADPFRRGCISAGTGAWWLRLESLHRRPSTAGDIESGPSVAGTWSVVFVGADGTLKSYKAPQRMAAFAWLWTRSRDPVTDVVAVHDWDGDGTAEIGLRTRFDAFEAQNPKPSSLILTFANGKIRPYEPARHIDFERIEDFDDDGRPDLVGEPTHTRTVTCCGMNCFEGGSPNVPWHARPDGTFSDKDDAAVAFYDEQCPSSDRRILPREVNDQERPLLNVACLRMRGVPMRDISQRVRAEWHTLTRDSRTCLAFDADELVRWAEAYDPPVRLPRP